MSDYDKEMERYEKRGKENKALVRRIEALEQNQKDIEIESIRHNIIISLEMSETNRKVLKDFHYIISELSHRVFNTTYNPELKDIEDKLKGGSKDSINYDLAEDSFNQGYNKARKEIADKLRINSKEIFKNLYEIWEGSLRRHKTGNYEKLYYPAHWDGILRYWEIKRSLESHIKELEED